MAKIAQVIMCDQENGAFIWKHPCENFNSLTQLIVHEGQEAIFFRDGEALDSFGAGRYTLETQNIPKLGKVFKQVVGSKNPFQCQVYFISTTVHMAVKWGTDSKVHLLDPDTGIPLEIGACGEMSLAVENPRKLLIKLVGAAAGIAWDQEQTEFVKSLQSSFRPLISTMVKANLAATIKAQNINILEIDQHLADLSEVLRKSIYSGFSEYGLAIPQFYVTGIVLPENDPNFRRLRDLHTVTLQKKAAEAEADIVVAERKVELERQTTQTEIARQTAQRELIRAQADAQAMKMAGIAEAEIMQAKGYNQRDVLQAEVQKAYAEGLGSMQISGGGGAAGDMIGLGVGLAAAGAVSGKIGEMFKGFDSTENANAPISGVITCPNCGSGVPENSKFCLECGTKIELLSENDMICPACGKKTAKGKFCMECGASLIAKCAKCGTELPNGARFCLECGEKL